MTAISLVTALLSGVAAFEAGLFARWFFRRSFLGRTLWSSQFKARWIGVLIVAGAFAKFVTDVAYPSPFEPKWMIAYLMAFILMGGAVILDFLPRQLVKVHEKGL